MAENGFAEGLAVGMTNGNNGGYNSGGFGLGGEWGGIIGLIAVASIFGNGGIFGGGNRGNYATQADVRAAVDQQTLISKIDQQTYGMADSFNSLNNTINSNFRGVDNALCTLGYQQQAGVNQISNLIQGCCCDLKQLNLENRYLNEKQTSEIIGAINAGNQRLVDIYTNDKIDTLNRKLAQAENEALTFKNNAYLLNELKPCPIPAYLTCNPNAPYGLGYGAGYGFGTHNGGCFGASVQ